MPTRWKGSLDGERAARRRKVYLRIRSMTSTGRSVDQEYGEEEPVSSSGESSAGEADVGLLSLSFPLEMICLPSPSLPLCVDRN